MILINFLKKIRIKHQILISILAVALFATVSIGIVIYHISKATIEQNYYRLRSNNLQISSRIIELQTEPIIEIGRSLLSDRAFRRIMIEETSDTPYFSGTSQLSLDRMLSSLMSLDENIAGMTVVNENGNWRYFSKNSSISGLANHYYTSGTLLEENWVQVARDAGGREVFYGYNVILPEIETSSYCFVKNLINIENNQSMGFLVVHIRNNLLERAFTGSIDGYATDRYMIVSTDGDEIIMANESIQQNLELACSEYRQYMKMPQAEGKFIFSSSEINRTDWQIVSYIERQELSRESAYIGKITFYVCALIIFISITISGFISGKISRPLKLLEHTINEVGSGSKRIDAEFDESEIGIIGNKFKQMVNDNLELEYRLLRSEVKEKEAELLLLQTQINPHFLYNTLDSLYFMALIKNADEIAEMVQVLSNHFKLNLNKGERFIEVRDELQKISEYMKIQNLRYKDRFDLIIEVDDDIKNKKILTFVLQPFVENAMYHGLEAKRGKGFIRIFCDNKNETLRFTIEDNGVGIQNPEKIENGYGIKNVRERIKLLYGSRYGVNFEERPGGGTRVIITLPDKGADYVQAGRD